MTTNKQRKRKRRDIFSDEDAKPGAEYRFPEAECYSHRKIREPIDREIAVLAASTTIRGRPPGLRPRSPVLVYEVR